MFEEMGLREAKELLQQQTLGHLACVVEGEPYVVPTNYLYDGECLFFHSLPGRKINALRKNPRCCLQVAEIENEYNWRSVIAFGNFQEITDEAERNRILRALFQRFPHLTPVESRLTRGIEEAIVFCLHAERITGVGERWK